eukprot:TRINITY_DN19830_c0_g1_i1.p1 TRINITY_DN19830_c0_g1~~TRINITY_DN19830_c0_g1_i1.p1  ORF type:complete len:397 (-),score=150.33 TRINITY_DN19830_c0_g1_i1:133-1323(-)
MSEEVTQELKEEKETIADTASPTADISTTSPKESDGSASSSPAPEVKPNLLNSTQESQAEEFTTENNAASEKKSKKEKKDRKSDSGRKRHGEDEKEKNREKDKKQHKDKKAESSPTVSRAATSRLKKDKQSSSDRKKDASPISSPSVPRRLKKTIADKDAEIKALDEEIAKLQREMQQKKSGEVVDEQQLSNLQSQVTRLTELRAEKQAMRQLSADLLEETRSMKVSEEQRSKSDRKKPSLSIDLDEVQRSKSQAEALEKELEAARKELNEIKAQTSMKGLLSLELKNESMKLALRSVSKRVEEVKEENEARNESLKWLSEKGEVSLMQLEKDLGGEDEREKERRLVVEELRGNNEKLLVLQEKAEAFDKMLNEISHVIERGGEATPGFPSKKTQL